MSIIYKLSCVRILRITSSFLSCDFTNAVRETLLTRRCHHVRHRASGLVESIWGSLSVSSEGYLLFYIVGIVRIAVDYFSSFHSTYDLALNLPHIHWFCIGYFA